MTDDSSSQFSIVSGRGVLGRWSRLCLKELREILRDRRTIVTLVVMPLVVYPLLALVFQRFLLSSLTGEHSTEYVVGFQSRRVASEILGAIERGQQMKGDEPAEPPKLTAEQQAEEPTIRAIEIATEAEAEAMVADGSLNLAVVNAARPSSDKSSSRAGVQPLLNCEVIYRRGSPPSEAALQYLQECIRAGNDAHLEHQLRSRQVMVQIPLQATARPVASGAATSFSLAALLPLILVLMTVTGAVYPAIDLTAGERERGTLETLIAAPIPRLGLLTAKYVAVLSVAVLTAVINLVGMTFTARSTGLDTVLLGEAGLTLTVALKVLALLVLFAAFFSAILLALTSYARSFKEAQAYIIPLMLVCLMPGIMCLLPGLQLGGLLAVTPLANIVLLARDLLEGGVDPSMAAAVVVSTAFYVAGAIALAARIFGTDAILYGSSASWSDLASRRGTPGRAVDMTVALGALALLFPCHFVLSNMLALQTSRSLEMRMALGAIVTILLFAGIPLLVVSLTRVRLRSGLQLATPQPVAMLAAVVLGLSLWPLAFEIVQWQKELGLATIDVEKLAHVKQLVDEIPHVSPWLLIATLGIVPGICEELFFRGFLLSAVRRSLSPWKAITTSALLFGLFHVVSASGFAERFLPSTFLGLVLGWVCVRTGSVVPGMILHAIHNSFLLLVAHYRDQLSAWGIGTEAETHLPLAWFVGSLVFSATGVGLLAVSTRRQTGAS